MNKSKLVLTLLLIGTMLLPYASDLSAGRKSKFSGLLPPQRLEGAVDANQALMTEEVQEELTPELHLVVNIPARQVTLYDKGQEALTYPIAVGQPIFKTPVSSHELEQIIYNPWWIPPDSPWAAGAQKDPPGPRNTLGPVKMMLGLGLRIHGTNKDSSVGTAASHGCMRMHNQEALNLAWYIQKRINNADDSLYQKYRKYDRSSFYVKLDFPVPVDIVYEPVVIKDGYVTIYNDFYKWGGTVEQELIDALIKNRIDIKKLNEQRVAALKYPGKRYEVNRVHISELFSNSPTELMTYMAGGE